VFISTIQKKKAERRTLLEKLKYTSETEKVYVLPRSSIVEISREEEKRRETLPFYDSDWQKA